MSGEKGDSEMSFNDETYAKSVWTSDKIDRLEADWLKQREGWYGLINPYLPNGLESMLDAGAGIGIYYPLLKLKAKRYVGIDLTPEMVERARLRHPDGDFRIASVLALPFGDGEFSLTFCWSLLVHLPVAQIGEALKELWRVTGRYLFFNLYVSLSEGDKEERGGWGEYLTSVSPLRLEEFLFNLEPRDRQRWTWDYEQLSTLGDHWFQRKIYLLEK